MFSMIRGAQSDLCGKGPYEEDFSHSEVSLLPPEQRCCRRVKPPIEKAVVMDGSLCEYT